MLFCRPSGKKGICNSYATVCPCVHHADGENGLQCTQTARILSGPQSEQFKIVNSKENKLEPGQLKQPLVLGHQWGSVIWNHEAPHDLTKTGTCTRLCSSAPATGGGWYCTAEFSPFTCWLQGGEIWEISWRKERSLHSSHLQSIPTLISVPCGSLLSPIISFPSHSVHPFLNTFISCHPSPLPLLTLPDSGQAAPCSSPCSAKHKPGDLQTKTNGQQQTWGSVLTASSLIGNNSQGRRFPGLPRWSCNSFMMV